jgi:superfamily II DNA or RNA helicase
VEHVEAYQTAAGSLIGLALSPGYSTGRAELIGEFYVPCLSVAMAYDRAVGYFRSSLYVLTGIAFSDFALRGGHARLICSPFLTAEDIDAISKGLAEAEVQDAALRADLRKVLEAPANRPAVELLATLVATGAMEIRLAFRPDATGIFHDKVGIFSDCFVNRVSFVGSANETLSAWSPRANHEGFEVFRSWVGDADRERVLRHAAYFDSLWEGREPGIKTSLFGGVARADLLALQNPDGIDAAAEKLRLVVNALAETAPTPLRNGHAESRRTLEPHQVRVVNNWFAAGAKGIIDHVTGGGKTISALEIVRRWIETGRPAIVFVPTDILVSQWRREADIQLGGIDVAVLIAGGHSSDRWVDMLADYTRNLPELGPRITIATIQTGSTSGFLDRVQQGEHLLVVIDEVHRAGSTNFRRILDLRAGGRLGLSATWQRFGDLEGTSAISSFCGNVLAPAFGLHEAIAAGRLVPYDYYVHSVDLADEEQEEWDKATERIAREYARLPKSNGGGRIPSEFFRLLLIQRAKILKHARGKVQLTRLILSQQYQDGDRWLVYCDTQAQVSRILTESQALGIFALEYHSAMDSDRGETLLAFEQRGGILVAIRCLDEGVDIPSINRALILASSSNPREFIQRRGRVLRKAQDKFSAVVHDVIVFPCESAPDGLDRSAILRTELRRAVEFAKYARNTSTRQQLEIWLDDLQGAARSDGSEEFEEEGE